MVHRMIPVGLAACLALFTSGCAGRVSGIAQPLPTAVPAAAPEPQGVPLLAVAPQGKPAELANDCPPLSATMTANSRLTPISGDLTRQLILSEIEQKKRIDQLIAAYEQCRRQRSKS